MILALVLIACSDPAMRPYRDALEAYDAGRAALAAGRAREAADDFGRVVALDPDSSAAVAWQAWALDQAGDVPAALAVLDQGLERFPADADLRYNRAALRARTGVLDGAADDLRVLYAAGSLDPAVAGDDPDFAALARDPSTASLAPTPAVGVEPPAAPGAVLLGDTLTVDLQLSSRVGELLSFEDQGAAPGLLTHSRTVEDLLEPVGRIQPRTLSITWRAVNPGEATLGPWRVSAGPGVGEVPALPVQILDLKGRSRAEATDEGSAVRSVEALFAGRTAPWAGRDRGELLVVVPAGAVVSVRGLAGEGPGDPVALELRRGGQTVAVGELYPIRAAANVRVSAQGRTLLEQDVAPEP